MDELDRFKKTYDGILFPLEESLKDIFNDELEHRQEMCEPSVIYGDIFRAFLLACDLTRSSDEFAFEDDDFKQQIMEYVGLDAAKEILSAANYAVPVDQRARRSLSEDGEFVDEEDDW